MQNVLKFDPAKTGGTFKILSAVNGSPRHKRHANDQVISNFKYYQAARIPYNKTHDMGLINHHGFDITNMFPNFDADVNDPNSYDFIVTDNSLLITQDAGTKIYFRLGESIEHGIKKYATLPPKDFQKWAEICEHIITEHV